MMNHHHPSSSDRLAAVVVAPGSGRRFPSCDGNMELDIPETWNSFWITHIYKDISHIYIYIYIYMCVYICIYAYVRTYVRMYVRTYVRMYVCIRSQCCENFTNINCISGELGLVKFRSSKPWKNTGPPHGR